jgi:hypothetical protein
VHPFAKVALGAAVAAYANQTLAKPTQVARLARLYANRVGKPMLSFISPPGATLKSVIRPPLALGDINLHPQAPGRANGPGQIGRGSPYHIPVRPRTFGSIFSVDTLEHLDRPDLALIEWHRVADRVFVVVPPWWTPEAWLAKWHIDQAIRRAWPVWIRQNRMIWLPSGQSRAYDAGTCPTPQPRTAPQTHRAPMERPRPPTSSTPQSQQLPGSAAPGPTSNESAASPPPPSASSTTQQVTNLLQQSVSPSPESEADLLDLEDLLDSSDSQSSSDQPYLPPEGASPSSTSVSSMMIMSGPDPESD